MSSCYLYKLCNVFSVCYSVCWSLAVCTSRVLLGRHHVLDVAAGMVIGVVEGAVLGWMWQDQEKAVNMFGWFAGEDPWSST